MTNHRTDAALKSTCLLWQPTAPKDWELKAICRVVSVNDDVLPSRFPRDTEISYVDISSVSYGKGIESTESMLFANAPSRARRLARQGDVIVSTVRTYLKALAEVDERHSECVFSTGFAVLRRRRGALEDGFLKWMTSNELLVQAIESHSTGVSYPAINAGDLVKLKVAVPPPAEQVRIAAHLDHETARIDALIEKKIRFIELLKEKRQALITQAVTKGLDPTVPMKDSGVKWIGEVPRGWKVSEVRYLTEPGRKVMYGMVLPGPNVENGVPYLKGGNVKPTRLGLEHLWKAKHEVEAPYARARLQEGDLVYSIRGSIGDCEIVPSELEGCNITQDVARISPRNELDHRWLRYALLSEPVAQDLACDSLGSAVKGINIYSLKRARLAVPPEAEQRTIGDFLELACARLDRLLALTKSSIRLLRERRSSLITAAVTGQIDLREDAA